MNLEATLDELPGELTHAQKEDLGRRMRELDENPSIGLTRDQLMERLQSRQ